jgi:hypothetical protein
MPQIFDNLAEDSQLVTALRQTVRVAQRADFCVGYFNLRGWKRHRRRHRRLGWRGRRDCCCRVLVGMQGRPEDELRSHLTQFGDAAAAGQRHGHASAQAACR